MARTNDFENLPCPHCGKKGLKWDYAAAQARCPHCHLSGFPAKWPSGEEQAPKPVDPPKPAKPSPVTNAEIEKKAKMEGIPAIVHDTYYQEQENGTVEAVVAENVVPVVPDDKRPDLTINFKWAMFHRWRLREVIEQEKRWGRDDLRKRGFVKVGRGLDSTGKAVDYKAIPGETKEATGRYALGQAVAVVRRAEQKLRGGDKKPPRDD